jgi:selenocysteine lyase/cysteine desulfurase
MSFRVVVFASIFEHHSNLLPWRESGADVVLIDEREDGSIDAQHLERELVRGSSLGLKMIGTFCAASNITGQLNDDLVSFYSLDYLLQHVGFHF